MKNNERDEQAKADQTVKTMESQTLNTDTVVDQQVYGIGKLLRQSSSHDLPVANDELREMLTQELASISVEEDASLETTTQEATTITAANSLAKPSKAKDGTPRFWRTARAPIAVATAAALMVAAFTWLGYQSKTAPMKLADGTILKYQTEAPQSTIAPETNSVDPGVEAQKEPKIRYRVETRTRLVPVQRSRLEAKARKVPVQRIRKEKRKRVLADGKSEEYEVSVPYTEMVTQNYTVQVPFTENVEQSYAVRVPYLVDESGDGSLEENLVFPDAREWRAKQNPRKKFDGIRLQGNEGFIYVPKVDSDTDIAGQSAQEYTDFQDFLLEIPYTEQYAPIHENQFVRALGGAAISTFSIDVDTAAYANMRRFINNGQMPPPDSVRIEELINYFQYDYPQPDGDAPFSVNMELANCPWDSTHKLLRVGLKGKEVHVDERPATNVVFLLDVSGSMNNEDKLPLLKRGFQMMVNELNENDRVAIVTYAGNAGVALEPTSGDQKRKINDAIGSLTPGGSTHGSAGIELAYQLAQKHFIKDGANKVILATDGDLNVGITEDAALVKLIKQKASENVFLTVLGFGTGNLKDSKMEQLADNGNGMYAYIDGIREARKVLVEQLSGSLVTIAKDVKLQIEFNPAEVASYRLIGYENRMLKTEDFDNDRIDAGEIGAGHIVTAIYELETTDKVTFASSKPVKMKYQTATDDEKKPAPQPKARLSKAAKTGDLLTLALRYKQPDSNTSKRLEFSIKNKDKRFASASLDFRFAASVASFGMLLRGSKYAGDANKSSIEDWATSSIGEDKSGYRSEFLELIRKARLQ